MSRFSPILALFVACCLLGSGCTSFIFHERGLPKRVEINKRVEEEQRRILVERTSADVIEIAVVTRRMIELRRRIVYNTITTRGERHPNPLWELVEIPYGLAGLIIFPFILPTGYFDFPESPNFKPETFHNRMTIWTAAVNPFASLFGQRFVRDPNTDKEVFFSKSKRTRYAVSLPEANQRVEYRLFDEGGTLLVKGEGETDEFGRLQVKGVPTGYVRLQARAGKASAAMTLRAAAQ